MAVIHSVNWVGAKEAIDEAAIYIDLANKRIMESDSIWLPEAVPIQEQVETIPNSQHLESLVEAPNANHS